MPDPSPSDGSAHSETSVLHRRRLLYFALTSATAAGLLVLMALSLAAGGFGFLDGLMLLFFAITVPWTVIGFWNATIGLLIIALRRDPVAFVNPLARSGDAAKPIASRVALLACIRNEDAAEVGRSLEAMLGDLEAAGVARHFHLFLLSDTSFPEAARAEAEMASTLQRRHAGHISVTYRRRQTNPGFKAGNIRDFCGRWGKDFDFAIVVDADSLMSAEVMLRITRMMEANPQLGILQTLVTGMPTSSAFARVFQFGMRLGMRAYTLGGAYWQGDCGPYWGHNAIIRLAPFIAHCELPMLAGKPPLGGHVLSHDQVEAVLMRRAGFEVRVLPEEHASFEQNPPTLLEFIRRDLRWCQGNMQYWRLLTLPKLRPVSRVQLALAIQMYMGSPAWIAFLALGVLRAAIPALPPLRFDPALGPLLFVIIMGMTFAPKIATALDVFARAELRRGFGGALRFAANLILEIVFSALLSPMMALAHALFMAGLPFGRTIGWTAQRRGDHAVRLVDAARRLWPQTLFGLAIAFLAWRSGYLLAALPVILGFVIAIPFAILTASPGFGRLLMGLGIGRIPEETRAPPILHKIGLPALAGRTADAGAAKILDAAE